MIKMLLALLLALAPQGALSPQTGVIEGRVTRQSNGVPIGGVQIVLQSPQPDAASLATTPAGAALAQRITDLIAQGQQAGASQAQIDNAVLNLQRQAGAAPQETVAITDPDGRFSFRSLAAGRYTLRAQRDGYYAPLVNGNANPVVTKTITVEADKTASGDLNMIQGGVIRGLIRDPEGNPAAIYAAVTARLIYVNGRAVWTVTGARNTDDRGEYRLAWLPPGEYYVGAGPRAPGPIANIQDKFINVFYPGVIDPRQALPVRVPEGGEATANFDVVVRPWGFFKISGTAINPLPTLAPNPTTGITDRAATQFILMPFDLVPLDNPPATISTTLVSSTTKPNGEYEIRNINPGRYDLYALVQDQPNRRFWTGHSVVEIRDKDITGLALTLSQGVAINGEVVVSGGNAAAVKPEQIRLSLQAMDTLPPQIAQIIGQVPVMDTAKFSISSVAEGRYRLNVTGLPPGAYVTDIRQGGTSVFDDGFVLNARNSENQIQIAISTSGETIQGDVFGALQKPTPNATVALIPPPSRRQNPALYRTAITDANGHFTMRGVPAGSYTIFAWESVLQGAWQNAEFLAKHQTRGKPVEVAPQTGTSLQLDLIRSDL